MLGKLKLKYIQSLGQKKLRDEEGVFIAEGPKLVAELLTSGKMIVKQLFALPVWIEENPGIAGKIETIAVTEDELEKISQLSTPNKVLAIVKKVDLPEDISIKGTIVLALDTIQDPGNLGTIIRIADWFGIRQVVCSHDSADIYNPKVVQSTMGSIARVNVIYTDLASWLNGQKDIRIYAATLAGQDITGMKKLNEGIIVIGNESKGISEEIMNLANVKVTIPKKGEAESLNAAVATGIILSHLT
jgi:TrmH family RNA methyltransferase